MGFNLPPAGPSSPARAGTQSVLERNREGSAPAASSVMFDEPEPATGRAPSPSALNALLERQAVGCPVPELTGRSPSGWESEMDRQQMLDLFHFASISHPVFNAPLVHKCFAFADAAHAGQYRRTGDPVITHCLETARILAELDADEATVAAALLHDILDDTTYGRRDMEAAGIPDEVISMVEAVSRVSQLSELSRGSLASLDDESVANLKNLLLSVADERPLIIKLADRLHNMRTLHALPAEKQRRFALETMDVYVPMTNRLGLWFIKAELEDAAFSFLEPEAWRRVSEMVRGVAQTSAVSASLDRLKASLDKAGLPYVELSGRPKSLYGIYKKLMRKGGLDAPGVRETVHDVRGIRVIVESKAACYQVWQQVTKIWSAGKELKDYIRHPKSNGYQSLHQVVTLEDGLPMEVQVRTLSMHLVAEHGIASHWRYKEGAGGLAHHQARNQDLPYVERRIQWLRWIISMQMALQDQKIRPSAETAAVTSGGGSPSQRKGGSPKESFLEALALSSAAPSALDDRFPTPLSPRKAALEQPVWVVVMDRDPASGAASMRVREVPHEALGDPAEVAERLGLPPSARVAVRRDQREIVDLGQVALVSGDVIEVIGGQDDWFSSFGGGEGLPLPMPMASSVPVPVDVAQGARRKLDTLFVDRTAASPIR